MMNNKEFIEFHKECCDKMHGIVIKKNRDYSGSEGSAFKNFTNVEGLGIASTEQGFLTRMVDKISRVSILTKEDREAAVKDEAVEDTLLDLANYCILMLGYITSKKKKYSGTIYMDQQNTISAWNNNDSTSDTKTSLACPPITFL